MKFTEALGALLIMSTFGAVYWVHRYGITETVRELGDLVKVFRTAAGL